MIHCWKVHIILLLKRVVVARPSSPITSVDSVAPDVLEVQQLDHFEGELLPPWDLTLDNRRIGESASPKRSGHDSKVFEPATNGFLNKNSTSPPTQKVFLETF